LFKFQNVSIQSAFAETDLFEAVIPLIGEPVTMPF
jgi:hypothetical protein